MTPEALDRAYNQAIRLQSTGKHGPCAEILQKITKKIPHHFAAWHCLGKSYTQLNRWEDGINCFKKSLNWCSEFYPASLSLAHSMMIYKKDYTEAEKILTDVSLLNPQLPEVFFLLSALKLNQEDYEKFGLYLNKFITLKSQEPTLSSTTEDITDHVLQAQLNLDPYLPHAHEEENRLKNLKNTLQAFLSRPPCSPSLIPASIASCLFHVAYYDCNPRSYLEKIAAVYGHLFPALSWVKPTVLRSQKPGPSRLKIGVVSAYLDKQHAVSYCFSKLIKGLDRTLYDIYYFRLSTDSQNLLSLSIPLVLGTVRCIDVPANNLNAARHSIAQHPLDILWYTDIGMTAQSYFLAFSRLAPVQCLSGGHPVTSGLKTIDYFLSSALLESPNAQNAYTEELITLPSLPVIYEDFPMDRAVLNRSYFHLPEDRNLYLCPQTLFKIHPKMDPIFKEILQQDPNALLVFCYKDRFLAPKLQERFGKTLGDLSTRCLFLPQVSQDDFFSLLRCVNVALDTFPFAGGNTSLQAISMGTPLVTLRSQHLRGASASALYDIMGITDGVANTLQDYINESLRLGTTPKDRDELFHTLMARKHLIFNQEEAVLSAYTAFFQSLKSRLE